MMRLPCWTDIAVYRFALLFCIGSLATEVSLAQDTGAARTNEVAKEVQALSADVQLLRADVQHLVALLEASHADPAETDQEMQQQAKRYLTEAGLEADALSDEFPNEFYDLSLNDAKAMALATFRLTNAHADEQTSEREQRNLLHEVENCYWDLWVRYQTSAMALTNRARVLELWRAAQQFVSAGDLPLEDEAQVRALYRQSTAQAHATLHGSAVAGNDRVGLYKCEEILREKLGLGPTDGRMIRPTDAPMLTQISPDLPADRKEALENNLDLRHKQDQIRSLRLEYATEKNRMLAPQQSPEFTPLYMGKRRALNQLRSNQFRIKKNQEELKEMEMAVLNELAFASRNLESSYVAMTDFLDQWQANEKEIELYEDKMESADEKGQVLDVLLRAQERRWRAQFCYFQAVGEYNQAIHNMHYLKGSPLDGRDTSTTN